MQTAGILAMNAAQLANAGEAAAARSVLLRLVGSSFAPSGAGLTNDWRGSGWTRQGAPDLDIGVNLGFASAVTECIVQSNSNALKVLPAVFPEIAVGRITDIATDFAARVSMEWDINRGRCQIKIMPKMNCVIDVYVPKEFSRIKTKELNFDREQGCIKGLNLTAGKIVVIEF